MYDSELETIREIRSDLYIAREVSLILKNELRADFINGMLIDCSNLIKEFELLRKFDNDESEEE